MTRVAFGAGVLVGSGCGIENEVQCSEQDDTAPMECDGVCINELGVDNDTWLTDTADRANADPFQATEDWVELYNSSGESTSLAGLVLERNDNAFGQSLLSEKLEIPAGGCLLLVASTQEEDRGVRTLSFDLNSDFGTVRLWKQQAHGPRSRCLVDRVYYGPQPLNGSFGRLAGGGLPWRQFPWTSPSGNTLEYPTPCGPPQRFVEGGVGTVAP